MNYGTILDVRSIVLVLMLQCIVEQIENVNSGCVVSDLHKIIACKVGKRNERSVCLCYTLFIATANGRSLKHSQNSNETCNMGTMAHSI